MLYIRLYYTCDAGGGHYSVWHSQSLQKHMATGNLMLSCTILFSELSYSLFIDFASILNFKIVQKSQFYAIQSRYLFPIVEQAYFDHHAEVAAFLGGDASLTISGDGRCDSPGHSTKYCTYTLILV